MSSGDDDEATCGVCSKAVDDPRILRCLHSFCRRCIEDLVGQHGPLGPGEVTCSVCKAVTQLPSEGAGNLAKDLTRLGRVVGCDSCKHDDMHTNAEMLCSTCDIHFCKEHGIAHLFANAGHSVTALCDERNLPSSVTKRSTVRPCSEHNLPVRYFCKPCSVSVCGDCLALGAHHGHKPIVAIKDISAQRKEAVRAKAGKLENVLLAHVDHSLADVQTVSGALTCAADNVRAELESARQRAVEAIDTIVKQKLSDVERLEERGREKLKRQQGDLERQSIQLKSAITFGKKLTELDMQDDEVCALLDAFGKRADGLDRLQAGLPDISQKSERPCVAFNGVEDRRQLVQHAIAMIGTVLAGPYTSDGRFSVHPSARTSRSSLISELSDDDQPPMKVGGLGKAQHLEGTNAGPSPSQPETSTRAETSEDGSGEDQPAPDGGYSGITLSMSSENALTFDTLECQPGLILSRDRKKVTHEATGKTRSASVLGSMGMQVGHHSWLVQITKSQYMDVFIGVAKKTKMTLKKNSHNTTYSWHGDGEKRINGKRTATAATARHMGTWQVADVLQLNLDCNEHVLSIKNVRSGESDRIRNLPDAELFPYFCLYDSSDTLTLLKYQRHF